MKLNIKFILSCLLITTHQINKTNSQAITEEQLNSYRYGADEFKLAIIGDSGTEREAREVMQLTTFDAILHLGDFDYNCNADKYFTKILDSNRKYQFMGVIGNHDARSQCGDDQADRFRSNIYNEMMSSSKNGKTKCQFSESKFMWVCVYKNMRVIGVTPGINGADKRKEQLSFLKKHLENAKEDWKICAWHFYDKYYHTGKYQQYGNIVSDDGESFYDYCKEHGAIVFSAHDHVYARTRVMSRFSTPKIDKYDGKTGGDIAQIRNGATINILNGAGGFEMYIEQGEQKSYSHWQKKYALGEHKENEKRFGGLFCNFNVGGNNKKAYCEFLRINSSNKVFDTFTIYQNENPDTVSYTQIDEDFRNRKIMSYKTTNHLIQSTNTNDNNNVTNNLMNNNNDEMNNVNSNMNKSKKPLSNILIGGGVCVTLVVLAAGLFLIKRNKKTNGMNNVPEIVINSPKEDKNSYRLDDKFTPLPIPSFCRENYQTSMDDFSKYHTDKSNTIHDLPLVTKKQDLYHYNHNNEDFNYSASKTNGYHGYNHHHNNKYL
ncbi:hypothetical protein BCR36DRAFT_363247 [Piromyces finnis]|uniref:Calcineurin-like phosphoesterase domain-containing protein n=1 Tax=Piromyces finnis TaxID=1754191 RepID=A0A1Y1UVD1_9FUNG|nr:hypothetical protein BCR36DRAFT_363247 [Piromyces finnis]|eukprot:ORX41998.1 hypothetical protein BCR36DRAFT_363247 [Piromyces finnis]